MRRSAGTAGQRPARAATLGPMVAGLGVCVAGLLGAGAATAEPLTRDTIRPLLIADVNALQANHYFLQSMIAFNSTPFTLGYSTQQAQAEFLRIDGATVPGGISKDQLVMSLGWGRPATGFAGYGVLNFAGVTAGDFPKPPLTAENSLHIRATNASVVAGLGVAYKGWVLQYGATYYQLRVHADQFGRLTTCGDGGFGCPDEGWPVRPGAPYPILRDTHTDSAGSRMLTLENHGGYSAGALFAELSEVLPDGTRDAANQLAALRFLAQPYALAEELGSAFGVGLNTYARRLDYYGDDAEAAASAAQAGGAPPRRDDDMVEIPLIADRIARMGFIARVVMEAWPTPLPRLAEVGYLHTPDERAAFVPHLGARAKVFRRGDGAAVAADAYAGFFWTITASTEKEEGRGMSTFVTWSYNSPDAANFVPLRDSHVIGLQLVWGNPAALAPPIPSVRVPESARYRGPLP